MHLWKKVLNCPHQMNGDGSGAHLVGSRFGHICQKHTRHVVSRFAVDAIKGASRIANAGKKDEVHSIVCLLRKM